MVHRVNEQIKTQESSLSFEASKGVSPEQKGHILQQLSDLFYELLTMLGKSVFLRSQESRLATREQAAAYRDQSKRIERAGDIKWGGQWKGKAAQVLTPMLATFFKNDLQTAQVIGNAIGSGLEGWSAHQALPVESAIQGTGQGAVAAGQSNAQTVKNSERQLLETLVATAQTAQAALRAVTH